MVFGWLSMGDRWLLHVGDSELESREREPDCGGLRGGFCLAFVVSVNRRPAAVLSVFHAFRRGGNFGAGEVASARCFGGAAVLRHSHLSGCVTIRFAVGGNSCCGCSRAGFVGQAAGRSGFAESCGGSFPLFGYRISWVGVLTGKAPFGCAILNIPNDPRQANSG